MSYKFYKCCSVPMCKSNTIKTPGKLFISVPHSEKTRKMWFQVAGRDPPSSTKSRIHFCEDHFDVPNDMENYMEYHIMGSVSQVRIKAGSLPSKFLCQPDRNRTSSTTQLLATKQLEWENIDKCLREPEQVNSTLDLQSKLLTDVSSGVNSESVIIKVEVTDTCYDEVNDMEKYDNPTDVSSEIECQVIEPFETIKCEVEPFETIKCEVIESFETHNELLIKDEKIEDTSIEKNIMRKDENITDVILEIKSEFVEPLETHTEFLITDIKIEPSSFIEENDVREYENTNNVNLDINSKYMVPLETHTGDPLEDDDNMFKNKDTRTFKAQKYSLEKEIPGRKVNIKKQLKKSIEKTKQFSCNECNRSYSRKSNLNHHMLIHTGVKPFSCNKCSKSFTTKYKLNNHMFIHTGVKPFSCNECSKSFTTKYKLNIHMLIHTGVKPFSCNECSKFFNEKSNLKKHMLIHTGKKPFSCNKCTKFFTEKGSLKRHMLVHTGERPFSCSECSKCFSTKRGLKRHTFIHTGERPYSCNKCSKKFIYRIVLNKHMKLMSCIECSESFTCRFNMNRHKLIHIANKPFS